MNPNISNINMHGMSQAQMGGVNNMVVQSNPMIQSMQNVPQPQPPPPPPPNTLMADLPKDKPDNISKIKSVMGPLKEALALTYRGGAYSLQQNNAADNLKRDSITTSAQYDKHLENFYAYCDIMELNLRTVYACMQQFQSSQYYLPGAVTAMRTEPYMQDNTAGPMPYSTYLNTVRGHIQSAKDLRDTLISASQNISQAD